MDVQILSSSSRATTGILYLVVITLVYNVYKAICNIYFHPLSKYPGPKHRAAWYAPFFYDIFKGTYEHNLKELHEKYGPVVRMRPDSLSFNSSGAVKDIYGGGAKKSLPKDPEFYTLDGNGTQSIIWSSDEDHTRMRKLLSHAFSDAALRGQEEILTHYFELMVSQLQKRVDDPKVDNVDMTKWYNFITFDVIGDLAYGESFGALESGEYHPWMRNLFQGVKATRVLRVAAFYQPLMKIIQALIKSIPQLYRARKEHMQLTKKKTLDRLEAKTDRQDFMTYILRHNDERGMTKEELLGTSEILIIAGSETTSTLLTGVTYFLLKNPEIYAKAKQEVRGAFKTGNEMTLQSTAQLPYLQAVLEEGLRMYPPVPLGLPRRTPPGGCIVNGEFVPGNTTVSVHNLSTLHSSGNFHEPEVFAPERWLSNPPEKYANDDKVAFNPFSTGPRNCIGKNLAWNEMRSILARMLFYFEMELCDDSQKWTDHRVFMLWDKPSLKIKLTHRKD